MAQSAPLVVKSTQTSNPSQSKPYLTALSSSKAAWSGIIVEHVVDLTTEAHAVSYPAHMLSVHHMQKATLEWTAESRTQSALYTSGDINITPAGFSVIPRWEEPSEFTLLTLKPQLINRVAQESTRGGRVEVIPRYHTRDPLMEQIALALISEVEGGGLTNRLYAESLATALAFHLVKDYSAFTSNTHTYSGGLSSRQLACAIDYINSHLDQTISLVEIADTVEVSSSHFARAFKQSTGIAPHKYLTERRIERAKSLLTDTNLPLAEIAFRLGFSSQGHFTTVFRQLLGTTPKSYRKAL